MFMVDSRKRGGENEEISAKFPLDIVSKDSINLSKAVHMLYMGLFDSQEAIIGEFKQKIADSGSKEELIMAKHMYLTRDLNEYSICIEKIITLVWSGLAEGEKEKEVKANIKENYSNYVKSISNVQRIWDDGLVSMINKSDSYIRKTISEIDAMTHTGLPRTTLSKKIYARFMSENSALEEFDEKLKLFMDKATFGRIKRNDS